MYTYEVRIDPKLKKPVVIYIKILPERRTCHVIRGTELDTLELEAKEWIQQRSDGVRSDGEGEVRSTG